MRIECERLANGGRLEWNAPDSDEAFLRVLIGHGRGCVLHGAALPATILMPLRGRLQLAEGDSARTLLPGQLLITEAGQRIQAIGRGVALWVAVFASPSAWRSLGDDGARTSADPALIPALHEADRMIRRATIRLVREASSAKGGNARANAAAMGVATQILDLQAEFDHLIERCPGRTASQRRAVFLRLQRVRNTMVSSCHLDLDIAGFARMASYSPCHFIRAFSTVYGETPHSVLVEQRLGRARHLISGSAMAITEIARASGFENRCAFSRSFKRRFGITASSWRDSSRCAEVAAC